LTLHLGKIQALMDHYRSAEDIEGAADIENIWDNEGDSYWDPQQLDGTDSSKFKSSDIDIFLYGRTVEQAERKIEHILAVLGSSVTAINRTQHSVSFVRGWPHRNVQVILRQYRSKGEILIGFDACAVGFDGVKVRIFVYRSLFCSRFFLDNNNNDIILQVYALPRFRRAMNTRCNLVGVDSTRHSPSYESR
jgi:hypothetical protein